MKGFGVQIFKYMKKPVKFHAGLLLFVLKNYFLLTRLFPFLYPPVYALYILNIAQSEGDISSSFADKSGSSLIFLIQWENFNFLIETRSVNRVENRGKMVEYPRSIR